MLEVKKLGFFLFGLSLGGLLMFGNLFRGAAAAGVGEAVGPRRLPDLDTQPRGALKTATFASG